jgi:hypothetical protein
MKLSHITAHATLRKQQRGISSLQVQLVEIFGVDHYQQGGSHISHVTEATIRALRQALDGLANVQLVKGNADQIVTVMHPKRRVHTTQYAA